MRIKIISMRTSIFNGDDDDDDDNDDDNERRYNDNRDARSVSRSIVPLAFNCATRSVGNCETAKRAPKKSRRRRGKSRRIRGERRGRNGEEVRKGVGGERGERRADGPTDAFPRFFVETCARRGGKGLRNSVAGRAGRRRRQKTEPPRDTRDSGGNRCAPRFHARGEFD